MNGAIAVKFRRAVGGEQFMGAAWRFLHYGFEITVSTWASGRRAQRTAGLLSDDYAVEVGPVFCEGPAELLPAHLVELVTG